MTTNASATVEWYNYEQVQCLLAHLEELPKPKQESFPEMLLKLLQTTQFRFQSSEEQATFSLQLVDIADRALNLCRLSFGEHRKMLQSLVCETLHRCELSRVLMEARSKTDSSSFELKCVSEYLSLLDKLWIYVSEIVAKGVLSASQQFFCNEMLGILYFRLPSVRRLLLEAIGVPVFPSHSWGSLLLEELVSTLKNLSTITKRQLLSFDIIQRPQAQSWKPTARLDPKVWERQREEVRQWIGDAVSFFHIINFLFSHVETCLPNCVGLNHIDGFGMLSRGVLYVFVNLDISLLNELFVRPASSYCLGFTRSELLLSMCTKALLYQTNVYVKRDVDHSLNVIDAMLSTRAPTTALPPSFCFDDFIKAISILLSSEDYLVLCKALVFVYSHLGRLFGPPRLRLVQEVLLRKDTFYRLFLHWHECVREVFQHILCLKLDRVRLSSSAPELPLPSLSRRNSLQARFRRLRQAFLTRTTSFRLRRRSTSSSMHSSVEDMLAERPMAHVSLFSGCTTRTDRYELSEDDVVLDRKLYGDAKMRLRHLAQQGQLKDGDVPVLLRAYAEKAFDELRRIEQWCTSLQKDVPEAQVRAPVISFHIPDFVHDSLI